MYLESRRTAQGVELHLTGPWRVTQLDAIARELDGVELAGAAHVLIDTAAVSVLDLSASLKLRDFMRRAAAAGAHVEFAGAPPDQLRLIATATSESAPGVQSEQPGPPQLEEPVTALGRRVVGGWDDLLSGLTFVGRIAVTAAGALRAPQAAAAGFNRAPCL